MITIKHRGDLSKTYNFLEKNKRIDLGVFRKYGERGVQALSNATPYDTGKTSESWDYELTNKNGNVRLTFINSNINDGVPIAIILQYGHGTRNGGWVEGQDYINPAIKPIFDQLAEEMWKEVTSK